MYLDHLIASENEGFGFAGEVPGMLYNAKTVERVI